MLNKSFKNLNWDPHQKQIVIWPMAGLPNKCDEICCVVF